MVPERKRKLLSAERETLICRSLSQGVKTISELSDELRVSEATVRRDLETLEAGGKLRRVHGGAELLHGHQEPVYEEKASRNAAEKAYIAEKAVSFIKDSDTIFLDGGSTVLELAKMLDRFRIIYTMGKGSTEKNPKYVIEESDVPSNEVLSYYAIEKWEFNSLENKTKKHVEAICPVLHRVDDYGGEPIRYPMFWVRLDDLRPYMAQQSIFISDDNNLPKYTYDDFFQLGMYKGDIYKTRNLRNLSLMQQFPDPDALKVAQDSIENRLNSFDRHVWVPTREELDEQAAAEEEARLRAEGKSDDIVVNERVDDDSETTEPKNKRSVRQKEKKEEKKKTVRKKKSNSNSGPVRSVRRTR